MTDGSRHSAKALPRAPEISWRPMTWLHGCRMTARTTEPSGSSIIPGQTALLLVDPNPQNDQMERIVEARRGSLEERSWRRTPGHSRGAHWRKESAADCGSLFQLAKPFSQYSASLGNYAFVKAGFAVFFPDHRAPHTFPGWSLGEAYVGASKDRDPVDVLTDDVMSGVNELVRRGVADPSPLCSCTAPATGPARSISC